MLDNLKWLVGVLVALTLSACCGGRSEPPPPVSEGPPVVQQPQAPPQPEVFPVLLHRRSNIGDAYRQSTVVNRNENQILKMPGQPQKVESKQRRIEFVAQAKVLVVDQLGQPTTTQYQIERFVAQPLGPAPGMPENVLPAGEVVTVVRGSPPTITTGQGTTLSKQQFRDLKAVISTGAVKAVTDDQVFGTQVPQAIGASWPINSVVAAQGLSDGEMLIQPDGLSGQTRLVSRQMIKGVDCLEIAAQLTAKNIGMSKLPPGSVVKTGQMEFGMSGFFPIDTTRQSIKGTTTSNARFEILLNIMGQTAEMEMTMIETEEEELTPLQ